MATSASQPYIARLGFQDPDRSKDRHGLACEYLYERLIELLVAEPLRNYKCHALRNKIAASSQVNQFARKSLEELSNGPYTAFLEKRKKELADEISTSFAAHESATAELAALEPTNGVDHARQIHRPSDCINVPIKSGYSISGFADVLIHSPDGQCLGEVKITRQPAEQVLQQINFYKANLSNVRTTYIITDYDCSDLQRLTQGSDVKVYRLGQRFEQWLATRTAPETPEL